MADDQKRAHSAALDLTETACDVLQALLNDSEQPAELRGRVAVDILARVIPQIDPVAFRQREQARRTAQLELDAQEAEAQIRSDRAALRRDSGPL